MPKPTQTQIGKAFEYSLITEASKILINKGFNINLVQDSNFQKCATYFRLFNSNQQTRYSLASIAAINHIISLEPRLVNPVNTNDILTLQLQPDSAGKKGDVRDILFIRSSQSWEIGISAKNNHMALKHSRLSLVKDFGSSWVGVPCSPQYFTNIASTFLSLKALKLQKTRWDSVPQKHNTYYKPVLDAFQTELLSINQSNINIPQKLITYLVGSNDFYKVIKKAKVVEILAFNMHGTLGKSINGHKPANPIQKLALPSMISHLQMMAGKTDTLLLMCDKGWSLSFRLHSAETLVVPSLKFDINLVGNPSTMYSNHISY